MKTSQEHKGGKLVAHFENIFPSQIHKVTTHNKQHLSLTLPLKHSKFILGVNWKDQH